MDAVKKPRLTGYDYQKNYRINNRDKYNATMLAFYHKNKERINAKRRERYKSKKKFILKE